MPVLPLEGRNMAVIFLLSPISINYSIPSSLPQERTKEKKKTHTILLIATTGLSVLTYGTRISAITFLLHDPAPTAIGNNCPQKVVWLNEIISPHEMERFNLYG